MLCLPHVNQRHRCKNLREASRTYQLVARPVMHFAQTVARREPNWFHHPPAPLLHLSAKALAQFSARRAIDSEKRGTTRLQPVHLPLWIIWKHWHFVSPKPAQADYSAVAGSDCACIVLHIICLASTISQCRSARDTESSRCTRPMLIHG